MLKTYKTFTAQLGDMSAEQINDVTFKYENGRFVLSTTFYEDVGTSIVVEASRWIKADTYKPSNVTFYDVNQSLQETWTFAALPVKLTTNTLVSGSVSQMWTNVEFNINNLTVQLT